VSAGSLLLFAALIAPAPVAAGLGHGPGLSAAAAASGRPPECGSGSKRALAKGPSIWELARVPTLQRYCDLMARAHAELPTLPADAKKAAEEADKALPGHAAPAVVTARAALALGAVEEAGRAFDKARAVDPRSVEEPSTMHDLARVLAKTGKRDEALGVYRALVPRIDLLGTADRRVSVLLEAAHLSMAAEGAGGPLPSVGELAKPKGGNDGGHPHAAGNDGGHPHAAGARPKLDEAVAYLREARQRPPTQLAGDVLLSLALALDRAGVRDEADAVLIEAERTGAKLRAGPLDYLFTSEDRAALDALAAEGSDRAAAVKAWEAYLAGPGGKGPWVGAARARLDALRRGGGVRAKAAPTRPRSR
jgi:tetratricopeptide (TPR) repeat protein